MEDVIAQAQEFTNKIDYHLDSDIKDVLRLQICKSLPTIEEIKGCLTVQQDNLIRLDKESNSIPWCSIMIIVFIIMGIVVYFINKSKELDYDDYSA